MKKEFKYQVYTPEYKDQVLDLLDGLWHFPKEEKLAYFNWKYDQNPFTESPACFIALDGNRVISFRGTMTIPLKHKDKTYLDAELSDTVTDPDYRRMGIFKNLTAFSISELEKNSNIVVSLASSSGGKTVGGYVSVGYKPFSERGHLFRFTVKGVFARIMRKPNVFKTLTKEWNDGRLVFTDKPDVKGMSSIPYHYEKLSHLRSERFYEWRLQNPHNNFVYAYAYDEKNQMKAFIIFVDMGDGRYDIVDFNTLNFVTLKDLLTKFCKAENPFYISLWIVGKENIMFKSSKKFGFVSLSRILNKSKKFKKAPFLTREIGKTLENDVHNPEFWDLYKIVADEI